MGLLTSGSVLARTLQSCSRTAPQTSGPFYPRRFPVDKDADLTFVMVGAGQPARARGKVVYIRGQVTDQNCTPVAGALVEIWQACESGRYNHPSDPNTKAPIDPNFQYWGKAMTDAQGRYVFKTVVPGAYPADATWWRPPHVHFKIAKLGYHELISQMYFDSREYAELNRKDLILNALTKAEQAGVLVKFVDSGPELEKGTQVGEFNIVVRKA